MRTGRPITPLLERFANSIQLDYETGCWNWIGAKDRGGYGVIVERLAMYIKRQLKAHRLSYEYFVGDIPSTGDAWTPSETTVDHICLNSSCVNPGHLRLLTRSENSFQSKGVTEKRNRTHCPKGHAYDKKNTNIRKLPNGRLGRDCKTCRRIRRQNSNAAKKRHVYLSQHPGIS